MAVRYVTSEEYENLKKVFLRLDTDDTGYLTIQNLKNAFAEVNLTQASSDISEIVAKLDYL